MQWDDLIAGCMRRAMREETEFLVANCKNGPSNAGVQYLACRKKIGVGVAYYLKRARDMSDKFSRSNTLYRLIHLRAASHALADRVHRFGEGSSPNCPCGCGVEETPGYFVFGCPTWEPLRELFYQQDVQVRGKAGAKYFKDLTYATKWTTVNKWLNGFTAMADKKFDKWLAAFWDMLAALLFKHLRWG